MTTVPSEPTAAEQVVARLDSYTNAEHVAHIEAARSRHEARKQRAELAAARLIAVNLFGEPTPEPVQED